MTSTQSKRLSVSAVKSTAADEKITLPTIKVNEPHSHPDKANPFHIPKDDEVFALRESERANRLEIKEKLAKMSIYEKSSIKKKNFKSILNDEDDGGLSELKDVAHKKGKEILLLKKQLGDRQFSKETLQEFVAKKREMFLVQYALGVKKEEMKKLEEIVQAEEQKLLDDEKALEEDAAKFDAFLKENDKNSVEAMKKAESETKAKLEKIQEIKKLNTQIVAIRSEMSKNEDQLKDYQRYREFLEKLTPHEWLQDQLKKKQKKDAPSSTEKNKKNDSNEGDPEVESLYEDADVDNEAPLYFDNPQQLLEIFSELEENNLSLIQNCQEMEETLEELKRKTAEIESNMVTATQGLRQQIEFLESAIQREQDKSKSLEERAKNYTNGIAGSDKQDKSLSDLHEKVKEVYQTCIGDLDGKIGTLSMLTSIENKLEQLFEVIELMPADKVEQAEKMKDKERRQRIREEKMDIQRQLQEERVQRALERAKAPVKKKTGKPLVFRSAPPQKKKKQRNESQKKEDEDLEFYFKE